VAVRCLPSWEISLFFLVPYCVVLFLEGEAPVLRMCVLLPALVDRRLHWWLLRNQ